MEEEKEEDQLMFFFWIPTLGDQEPHSPLCHKKVTSFQIPQIKGVLKEQK